jgi:hypothetical protein
MQLFLLACECFVQWPYFVTIHHRMDSHVMKHLARLPSPSILIYVLC